MNQKSPIVLFFFFVYICMQWVGAALADDLEPRRWTPLPIGTNVAGVGYVHTSGEVYFDPVLNVEDAEVEMDTLLVSYVNSFSLAGKLARFDVLVPWQDGRWEGILNGEPASVERQGLADPIVRLSINLLGAPAAGPAELQKYMASHPVNTLVGAAVSVSLPLGEYFENKLLNLGQNRYIIRPQVGVLHTRGPWSFELTGSGFFYTDNDEFYNGKTREQEPVYALQAHVIRIFKPGVWSSLSTGYGEGGRSTINGQSKDDENANVLWALSFGLPTAKNQGVKFAYVRARTQRDTGSDTDSLAVGWSIAF